LESNAKLADAEATVPDGPEVIEVSGGVVSGSGAAAVHVLEAGDGSVFPAASVARTSNVCEPSLKFEYAFGELHAPHALASRRHS
jgi:hypothetical protein